MTALRKPSPMDGLGFPNPMQTRQIIFAPLPETEWDTKTLGLKVSFGFDVIPAGLLCQIQCLIDF
jgi:hypothetical protein